MKVFQLDDDRYLFFDDAAEKATVEELSQLEAEQQRLDKALIDDFIDIKDDNALLEWARHYYPFSPDARMMEMNSIRKTEIEAKIEAISAVVKSITSKESEVNHGS